MPAAIAIESFVAAPAERVSDELLRDAFTAAVRLYAARVGEAQSTVPAVQKDAITATEAVIAICALMHAADLNPFDVAMWYRRPPPQLPAEAR